MGPHVDVVPAPIPFVQEVGQNVVFKAVDNAVVIHIDAKEEFGAIRCVAQERLLVIRHRVLAQFGVILIEVVDEVVVLVEPWKDLSILREIGSQPIGIAVLIVVVVNKFVNEAEVIVVVDVRCIVLGPGQKRTGAVAGINIIDFAEAVVGISAFIHIDKPSVGRVVVRRMLGHVSFRPPWIAKVPTVAVVFPR